MTGKAEVPPVAVGMGPKFGLSCSQNLAPAVWTSKRLTYASLLSRAARTQYARLYFGIGNCFVANATDIPPSSGPA